MTETPKNIARPIILVFILVNAFVLLSKSFLFNKGFDSNLLIWGNLLLFIIGIIALFIQSKGAKASNPNVFVRSVYLVMIIKLFIVAVTLTTYILLNHRIINKPSVFTLMGLYVLYTILEVSALMKLFRKKNV
jgi:hypothetical protein